MNTEQRGRGGGRLTGVVTIVRNGKKGYFLREDTDDIEIPQEWFNGVLSGDVAEVELSRKYGKEMARVVRVIERKSDTFVGELIKKADMPGQTGGVYVTPDNGRVYFDFRVEGAAGAHVGEKVIAKVVSWDTVPPSVSVTEVLGVAGDHETEMKAIIAARGFDAKFPQDVLSEAQHLYDHPWDEAEIARREDFRGTLTFTIDPEDAKDFDDAISFKRVDNGNIEIGVHIADVSYFVRPGGAIEREAYRRATSVYLVDRTVPMLPPQLSEDLCSLKPDSDRLTFSAVFTVSPENEVVQRRFVRGIIHSDKRFTYDDVDPLLASPCLNSQEFENSESETEKMSGGNDGVREAFAPQTHVSSELQNALHRLWSLASLLREKRKESGAIMFDSDEIRPVLNEAKEVIGFKKSAYTESHQLIEELMLLANREVATFVSEKLGKKSRLFIYRIHDKPDPDKLDELSHVLRAIGYSLERGKEGLAPGALNRLLDTVKGTPEEALIRTATVRTMSKAIYATKNIGHFGLSFEFYTHFTSPIRRYPDLMVHRVLATLIQHERIDLDPDEEAKKAVHTSEREALAAEAERASVKLKQVEYFAKLIGQKRKGVVSGVTEWGVYIADDESAADGMVRLATISDDIYEYDPKKYAIIGQKTGRQIRLGDPIEYVVESVDIDERTIDFRLP